ncbi:hypothetical protein KR018_005590 [Drosophila ironensis]|nr:hypothetical protein KR018_005590 [Drosophila ironensis]
MSALRFVLASLVLVCLVALAISCNCGKTANLDCGCTRKFAPAN